MDIDTLQAMVGTPRDSAMLRLALARLLARDGRAGEAEQHLEAATVMDSDYAAAWKELGRLRRESGDSAGAAEAWKHGLAAAARQGDKQAEKEMTVFLRRLDRERGGRGPEG